jgi:hypothetical protein
VIKTPSAPFSNALNMKIGSTLPEHITLIILIFGGYCFLDIPAKSAPAYEHQLQANVKIRGLKSGTGPTSKGIYHLNYLLPCEVLW